LIIPLWGVQEFLSRRGITQKSQRKERSNVRRAGQGFVQRTSNKWSPCRAAQRRKLSDPGEQQGGLTKTVKGDPVLRHSASWFNDAKKVEPGASEKRTGGEEG